MMVQPEHNRRLVAKLIALGMLLIMMDGRAQPNGFRLGVTTPESLPPRFREQAVYVKGTIALSCNHVRAFTADSVGDESILMTRFTALFYDNRLFTMSCDYTDDVKKVFLPTHAKRIVIPTSQLALCESETDKPLSVWGEVWEWDGNQARLTYADGYGTDCKRQKTIRFSVTSQRLSALASDCDLTTVDPLREAFDRALNERAPDQRRPEPKRTEN